MLILGAFSFFIFVGYVPFTTHDPIYHEYDHYTANNNNDNDYGYSNPNYDDIEGPDDIKGLIYPASDPSTKSPPTKVITFMPIDSNDDEGTEVRYNEKVASYGLD